jgi:hypothetical protein
MNPTRNLRASRDVVFQKIGEETVLLNLKTGVYWGLNHTGAVIWEEMARHGDAQRAAAALEREFEGTREQMLQAVNQLLDELAREGLMVPDDAA